MSVREWKSDKIKLLEVNGLERCIKKVLLCGKDDKGNDCYCDFFNPSCQKGYSGECIDEVHYVDRFSGVHECFKNNKRDHAKSDI